MSDVVLHIRKAAGLEVITSRTARRTVAVAVFALLTTLSAYVTIPVPGTPVPVTLQTMVVILSGALLGARLGAASQLSYLAAGALGAPVFFGGLGGLPHLFGPTGGYLLAFPAAAALAGWIAGRTHSAGTTETHAASTVSSHARSLRLVLALTLGAAVILASGAAQLAAMTGSDLSSAVTLGVLPFVIGDAWKVGLAFLIARRLRRRSLGRM